MAELRVSTATMVLTSAMAMLAASAATTTRCEPEAMLPIEGSAKDGAPQVVGAGLLQNRESDGAARQLALRARQLIQLGEHHDRAPSDGIEPFQELVVGGLDAPARIDQHHHQAQGAAALDETFHHGTPGGAFFLARLRI